MRKLGDDAQSVNFENFDTVNLNVDLEGSILNFDKSDEGFRLNLIILFFS